MNFKYFGALIVAISIDAFDFLATAFVVMPFIGIELAAAIDFVVDATFGTGLIVLLIFLDLLSPYELMSVSRLPFILGKLMPGFDIGPWYTVLVISLIVRKESAHDGLVGTAAALTAGALGGSTVVQMATGAMRSVRAPEQSEDVVGAAPEAQRPGRVPIVMQDVRIPASDAARTTAAA